MKLVRLIIRIALIAIALACVMFFLRQAVDVFARVSLADALAHPWQIAACLVLSVAWIGVMTLFWDWSIRRVFGCGQLKWADTFSAFTRSYIARYMPGKIWIIATRIEPLKRKGAPSATIVSASAFEQISIAVGTFPPAILLLFAFLNSSTFAGTRAQLDAWLTASLVAIAVLIAGSIIAALLARPVRAWLGARFRGADAWIPDVTPQNMALGLVGGVGISLLQAVNVLPLVPADRGLGIVELAAVCLAYPTARVIGQLGSFSPAGLGVREGAFVLLTTSFIGAEAAVVVAVWMRAISLVAEAVMYGVGAAVQWRSNKEAAAHNATS
jgi:glycosyltransferase 2 family protein